MKLSGKHFTAFLLLFSHFAAAQKETPMMRFANQSCPISHSNVYSLLFKTCNPSFNYEESYSTGLTHLSYIYLAFSFVYLLFLAFWISISLKIKQHFRRIPFLMAGLILMKLITLICAAEDKYYEKITGSRILPDLLIFAHQIINSVRLFIIVLLIVNVWPLVKPCLKPIDVVVLSVTIPLRILSEGVAIIVGENVDVKDWSSWNEMVVFVDILINPYFIVISFTLLSFGVGARASERLELVRTFYLIATIYLMAMRVLTMVRSSGEFKVKAVYAYEYLLKSNTAVEGCGLVFYVVSFRLFMQFLNDIE